MELHPHTHITPSVSGQAVQATLIGDYSSFETAPNFESKYLAVPGLCECMCVMYLPQTSFTRPGMLVDWERDEIELLLFYRL